jgi:hypothetical protein
MKIPPQTLRIGAAAVIILGTIIYLAITGVQADKSYYVTIGELQAMGNKAYTRHLRVAGDVAAHSIERSGTNAKFVLAEQGHTLQVRVLSPHQTPSKTVPRRSPWAPMGGMASSMRPNYRPSVLPNMRPPNPHPIPLPLRRRLLRHRPSRTRALPYTPMGWQPH